MRAHRPTPAPRRRRKDRAPLTPFVGTPLTVPNATDDLRNAWDDGVATEPTHEDIARRAYQLYQARGDAHGRDQDDWFQAERELRQCLHDAGTRILAAEGSYTPVESLAASYRALVRLVVP